MLHSALRMKYRMSLLVRCVMGLLASDEVTSVGPFT